jgi:hypothetical protein
MFLAILFIVSAFAFHFLDLNLDRNRGAPPAA